MKKEIKQEVSNLILDICKLSPEHDNAIVDIIGADAYKKVIDFAKSNPLQELMHDLDSIRIPYEYTEDTLYYPNRDVHDLVYVAHYYPERKDSYFDMCEWENGDPTRYLCQISEEKAFNLILTHWHLKSLEKKEED